METRNPIQWYPGHIAKLERQLKELLQLVDVVIEVVDARIPLATINSRLRKQVQNKPVLTLLNKADLADPIWNKRWLKAWQAEDQHVLLFDAKTGQNKKAILQALIQLGEEKMQALERKGMKRRPIRVVVTGMPNVGKSSIINSIVGKKKTQTGHKAGVTRQPQWVRIHPSVELLDVPGIIPPRLDSPEVGILLATVSSVGEAVIEEEEVAQFLIDRIQTLYPGLLHAHYHLEAGQALSLERLAESRNYRLSGTAWDCMRMARTFLSEFRQGRLGRMTLEHADSPTGPPDGAAAL